MGLAPGAGLTWGSSPQQGSMYSLVFHTLLICAIGLGVGVGVAVGVGACAGACAETGAETGAAAGTEAGTAGTEAGTAGTEAGTAAGTAAAGTAATGTALDTATGTAAATPIYTSLPPRQSTDVDGVELLSSEASEASLSPSDTVERSYALYISSSSK